MKHFRPHILVVIALATVLLSGWHGAFRNALTDLRFAWEQRQATGEIVVIAIDARSIEKIGIWPWPRRLHAELLRQLQKARASDIVFDVDFSAPSDPGSDNEFVAKLRDAVGDATAVDAEDRVVGVRVFDQHPRHESQLGEGGAVVAGRGAVLDCAGDVLEDGAWEMAARGALEVVEREDVAEA